MCKCGSLTPYVSDCCCGPKPLVIEAGKIYVSARGCPYYIIGFSKNGQLIITEAINGHEIIESHYKDGSPISKDWSRLVKEFKEPKVHKRIVYWYKNSSGIVYFMHSEVRNLASTQYLGQTQISFTEDV